MSENATISALKMEGKLIAKEWKSSLEVGKNKETDFPLCYHKSHKHIALQES